MTETKNWTILLKNITMLTQFGISFITPLLLCLGICWWLTSKFNLGGWIFIPGFFFGLGGTFTVGYKFYVSIVSREKKKEGKKKVSYNRHV